MRSIESMMNKQELKEEECEECSDTRQKSLEYFLAEECSSLSLDDEEDRMTLVLKLIKGGWV